MENYVKIDVDRLRIDDRPLALEVWQIGGDRRIGEARPRYAYNVWFDGEIVMVGSDLYGPANSIHPEAEEMAATLAGFLGATYECGELTEHGKSYEVDQQAWLAEHAERLSMAAETMRDYIAGRADA